MFTSTDLANNIKARAKAKGYTIEKLLNECKLGENTINQLKHKQGLSCFSLLKIAQCLECSIDFLMGRTDNPEINKNQDQIPSKR